MAATAPRNTTGRKTLDVFNNDVRIDSIWSEKSSGDGYWAGSARGFYFPSMECHTAHEDTVSELYEVLKTVAVCTCDDCKGAN